MSTVYTLNSQLCRFTCFDFCYTFIYTACNVAIIEEDYSRDDESVLFVRLVVQNYWSHGPHTCIFIGCANVVSIGSIDLPVLPVTVNTSALE